VRAALLDFWPVDLSDEQRSCNQCYERQHKTSKGRRLIKRSDTDVGRGDVENTHSVQSAAHRPVIGAAHESAPRSSRRWADSAVVSDAAVPTRRSTLSLM